MGRRLLEALLLVEIVRCSVTVTNTDEIDSLLMAAPYPDACEIEKTGSALLTSVGEESIELEPETDGLTVEVMVIAGWVLERLIMRLDSVK